MNHAVLTVLIACVVCMSIFNLAASLLFIRIVSQVNRAEATSATQRGGRRSPRRIYRTFVQHRTLYPASRLRLATATLMGTAVFAFLLLMVLLFSNAPRASRPSSSQTIKSLR
jgi:hypothetical protein